MTFSRPTKVKYELYCPVATDSKYYSHQNIDIRDIFQGYVLQI